MIRVRRAAAVVAVGVFSVVAVFSVLAALAAPPAWAYVRTRTAEGVPISWPRACVPIAVYPAGLGGAMTDDEVLEAARGAAAAWHLGDAEGAWLSLDVVAGAGTAPRAAYDRRNVIVFLRDVWGQRAGRGEVTYDPSALAITTVFSGTRDGQIRDADVEVNARSFTWSDLADEASPSQAGGAPRHDLQNALAHELGHLVGLDHPCVPAGGATRPRDHLGHPVPDCSAADEAVRASTMFPSVVPGDTSRRTLAPDDLQALLDVYGAAERRTSCAAPPAVSTAALTADEAGGCAFGGAPRTGGAGALALVAGALAAACARRRRRTR